MDIILVPGLWLDASSWDDVVPVLERAGHTAHALTMPGVGVPAPESSEIGIADWVAATVAAIDRIGHPVLVVGHSGGGNVAYGAVDARPDRVAGVVFLDTFPPRDGGTISEFPIVDGVVPFPGWDFFDDDDVADLTADVRVDATARTRSVPARVPTDPIALGDDRRRGVPATMLTSTVPEEMVRAIIAEPPAWASELAALAHLEIVALNAPDEPSGHWPQFSRPDRVADAIVVAAERAADPQPDPGDR